MFVWFSFIFTLETELVDFMDDRFVFVSLFGQKRSVLSTPTIDMWILVITLPKCDVWFSTIKGVIFFLSQITQSGSSNELLVNQVGL